jgi:hypothetical protein
MRTHTTPRLKKQNITYSSNNVSCANDKLQNTHTLVKRYVPWKWIVNINWSQFVLRFQAKGSKSEKVNFQEKNYFQKPSETRFKPNYFFQKLIGILFYNIYSKLRPKY